MKIEKEYTFTLNEKEFLALKSLLGMCSMNDFISILGRSNTLKEHEKIEYSNNCYKLYSTIFDIN